MKKGLGLAFLVLALIHYGASAPRRTDTGDAAGNPKKSGKNTASVSPQGFAAEQILKFFGRKTGKELMAEKKSKNREGRSNASLGGKSTPGAFELSPNPVAGVPNVTKDPALSVSRAFQRSPSVMAVKTSAIPGVYTGAKVNKIEKLAVPPPPVSRVSVPQIRQEIQKILELNKQIKNVQSGRAGQFQRVQEQARLHQKILNDLEFAKREDKDRKIPQREDLLAQEKLRIIHEETRRNAALLDAVDSDNATSSGQDSASPGSV